MPVRTKALGVGASPTTLTAVYTCPADETAILKDARFSNASTTATYAIRLAVNRSGVVTTDLVRTTLGPLALLPLEPWVVLHPGDALMIQADNALVRYWLSGSELDGVAT